MILYGSVREESVNDFATKILKRTRRNKPYATKPNLTKFALCRANKKLAVVPDKTE